MNGDSFRQAPPPPAAAPPQGGIGYAGPWTSAPTPEHLAQITVAKQRGKKIRNAVSVALFSGWSTAIFAFLTLFLGVASFSVIGSVLGIGMAIVSLNELRGAAQVKRLDPKAPRRLAMNQIFFGVLIFAYGAISLWTSLSNPSEITAELTKEPELKQMIGPVDEIVKLSLIAVYGGVMLFAIVGPGLTAWYYVTRRRYVEEYARETPQWILDLQRAGMSL